MLKRQLGVLQQLRQLQFSGAGRQYYSACSIPEARVSYDPRFKQHTITRRQVNLSHYPKEVARLFPPTCRVISGATGWHLFYIQDIIHLKTVPNFAWPRDSRFLVPDSRWQLQRAAPSRESCSLHIGSSKTDAMTDRSYGNSRSTWSHSADDKHADSSPTQHSHEQAEGCRTYPT
jgi:hypothetical protein